MATAKLCGVLGCEKPLHAHGFCARHAYRFRAHGDPEAGRRGASPGEPLRWIEAHAGYRGDDCLRWPFEVTRHGYGTVKHDGKRRVASRVMCIAAHGPAPSETHEAAHSCGNGHLACMNPTHLRWATRAENMQDAKEHGSIAAAAKKKSTSGLDEEKVRAIRALSGSLKQREIADMFGIGETLANKVINGRLWAWVK